MFDVNFSFRLIFFLGAEFQRCHVMEVESFENEEVAKLLNDWFVSIKVLLCCFLFDLTC
jgi:hypothetical protein